MVFDPIKLIKTVLIDGLMLFESLTTLANMLIYWIFFVLTVAASQVKFIDLLGDDLTVKILKYLNVKELASIKCADKYMHDCFRVANAHAQKLAQDFALPALAEIPDHFDLAVFDGYKFTDSEEDLVNKLVLLFAFGETSLQYSPIRILLYRILAQEVKRLTAFRMQEFQRKLFSLNINPHPLLLTLFLQFNMHREACLYVQKYKFFSFEQSFEVQKISESLVRFANVHPQVLKKWFLATQVELLCSLITIELKEASISVLFKGRIGELEFCDITRNLIYPELTVSPRVLDKRDERFKNLKRIIDMLPGLSIHKKLMKIATGNPISEEEINEIKSCGFDVYFEAGRLAVGSGQFELAFNLILHKNLRPWQDLSDYHSLLSRCPAFEKFLMESHPEMFLLLRFPAESNQSLYSTMSHSGITSIVEAAITNDPETWKNATEEDFELIYEATKNTEHSVANHNAFTRLAARRYETPEGRAWIGKEAAESNFYALFENLNNFPANLLDLYTNMKFVLVVAHEEYLAQFIEGPHLILNQWAVIKALYEDSAEFAKALPHMRRFKTNATFCSLLRGSPKYSNLARKSEINDLKTQINHAFLETNNAFFYALNYLAFADADFNVQDIPESSPITIDVLETINFFRKIRHNLSETKLEQIKKVCTFYRLDFDQKLF